jgi:hypothetical protein
MAIVLRLSRLLRQAILLPDTLGRGSLPFPIVSGNKMSYIRAKLNAPLKKDI